QVLNRATVQAFYQENFRVIAMDAEGDLPVIDFDGHEVEEHEFALKAMRVRATPVFAFFNPQGELITRYTGALKSADDFIILGNYVIEEKYQDMKFSKYRREQAKS
ncbi:MAG: thioredoxin fold domain-containing protein, partial [Gammaproteobacteria bacterium]|nr:thioredoxin fold domain-containing protein [Gammaproteobacteria bacterium]